MTTTLSESGLIAETSFDSTVLATPAVEVPVEEAAIEAEITADVGTSGETRAARILSKIKSAPGKILRSAGKFAKRFAKKVPLFALKNPIVAYVLYELGKSTVNDISDAIREATSNYEAEFGADQKEIEEIIASAIDYVRQFETLEEKCPSAPTKSGDLYSYKFGDLNFQLYESDTRGDEYGKKGLDLYPDR